MRSARRLPDTSRLLSLPARAWAALGDRLRAIGLDARYVAGTMRVGERLDDALRAPMRTWSLRRRHEPAADAVRMLMLGDPVPRADAQAALGDLGPLMEVGLLLPDGDHVVSPFRLDVAFERFFVADDLSLGGDAVMGPSATTSHLCRAARPSRKLETLVDVGCGAGTVAIVLAEHATKVVATDINPRALILTEVNARLNGVSNLVLRQGDLLDAVKGESFDLIVSQPPFVARTIREDRAPFLFGGARGDEIALRLLGRVGDHLAEGGRAVILVDWPVVDDDAIEERVRRAIPEVDMNALLVQSPSRALEDHCTLHAASAHRALDEQFAHSAMAMRDHFEAMNVRGLRLTVNALARRAAPGWTSTIAARHFVDAPPTGAVIDHALAARELVAAGRDALLDAKLRIVPHAVLEERTIEPGAPPVTIVRLPDDRLVAPVILTARAAAWAQEIARAPSVRAVADRVPDVDALLADVRDALLRGVLDLAD